MFPLLLCRFVQTSAAVLLAGTVVLRLLSRGTANPEYVALRWNRLAAGAWAALLVAGAFQLELTAAEMSGLPPMGAFSVEVLGSVLVVTRFGTVWLMQMAVLTCLLVTGLAADTACRRRRWWATAALDAACALLAAILLASLVCDGHAAASEKRGWLLPVDIIHAVTAGAWPGGLWAAGIVVGAGTMPAGHDSDDDDDRPAFFASEHDSRGRAGAQRFAQWHRSGRNVLRVVDEYLWPIAVVQDGVAGGHDRHRNLEPTVGLADESRTHGGNRAAFMAQRGMGKRAGRRCTAGNLRALHQHAATMNL